jgi:uncharacterized protein (TIGR02147 family)
VDAFYKDLLNCNDPLQFLKVYLNFKNSEIGRGAQSSLSRNCGFKSRSYLNEILKGKKAVSKITLSKLKRGLKLPIELIQYFEHLVNYNQSNNIPDGSSESLKHLRNQLEHQLSYNPSKDFNLTQPEVFQVYAGLGSIQDGSTIDEIRLKTGLSLENVEQYLKILCKEGLALEREKKYYPLISKVDKLSQINNHEMIQMIQKVSIHLAKKSKKQVHVLNELNLYFALSLDSNKMNNFKESLKLAVLKVLDEFQDDKGDKVVQVYCHSSFTPFETSS